MASLRLSWSSPSHPTPQVSLSAIWACEVTQQLEAGPKGARPWAGAGMGHSLEGSCGRTVGPQSMVRTAPPSPWALRQQQGGVLSTSGVPCDPDPMPPVGHSLAPTAAEAISGLNHPPERECYTFRCRNIYVLRSWGGGCPRPHRGVRPHTTHAPMLHSYNPNHPGSGHVAGLEPGAWCPLRVTEPRAARVPRRGQKPPGGRFWEDFRGTGAGRRGSRGLPWPPGQGPQAEVGLPAPTCRLVRSQEL